VEDEDGDEEEEGEVSEISVLVLARNEPPAWACQVCGKPATRVSSGEEYSSLEEAAFCDECAQKQESADEMLPMVNSPRVGVCAYTGEEEDWEEEDWEEDEEEDE